MSTEISLAGRNAIVTGASRGIGRAIAVLLAEAGADVAVNYNRDEEAAAETVKQVEALGRKAKAYQAAVDDYDAVVAMVDQVVADFGPISILVNNAGIASRGNSVIKTDPKEFERVMRVHTFGPFYASQAVLPSMRECERGDIIMISSVASKGLAPNGAPYNMAKTAENALAVTLAKEERRHGIRTNVVAPGLVETDMGSKLMKAVAGVEDMRTLDANAPLEKSASPKILHGLSAIWSAIRTLTPMVRFYMSMVAARINRLEN